MTFEQITSTLKQYITEKFLYHKPDIHLANDTALFGEGIIDSLQLFQLLAFIEEQFQCKLSPFDVSLENFESINTITMLVSRSK